ncbi:transforming growth factor beta regulator 1 isoform X2 [Struthio camelus]
MTKVPRKSQAEKKYRLKYSRLRRAAKALVFENAALCDEIARLEAKFLRARDERRFLLARLLQLRALPAPGPDEPPAEAAGRRARRGARQDGSRVDGPRADGSRPDGPRTDERRPNGPRGDERRPNGPRADERRPNGPRGDERRPNGPRTDERRPNGPRGDGPRPDGPRGASRADGPRGAARRRGGERGWRRAAAEAGSGGPTLPLALGPLTVHSLGRVPADRPGFRQAAAIFPLGYRSTRLFASARRPARRCLYTCRIADGGAAAGPRFEIVAEDEPGRVMAGPTPDACHARLLEALAAARGRRGAAPAPGAGADFFGLTHPAVHGLLRGRPGVRRCGGYRGSRDGAGDGEAGAFLRAEEEDEEEEEEEEEAEEEEDDEDEEDEEEEEEEAAAVPAFGPGCSYGDVFLGRPPAGGSPAGSDD